MDNVTDFLAYKEQKRKIDALLSSTDVSKLGQAEQGHLIQSVAKLVQQQSDLLNTVMLDMTLLVERMQDMQQQFIYISGQAYLGIQMLREKNICSPEEIETAWAQIVKEKILQPQGLEDLEQAQDNVNESDLKDFDQTSVQGENPPQT
jgi:hypothetical protein